LAFKHVKYYSGGRESGPLVAVKLLICAVMLLLPLFAPGTQSLMLLFIPGFTACMLYEIAFMHALGFLSAIFFAGSILSYLAGRADAALWIVQSTGTALLILTGIRYLKDGPDIFLKNALFLCLTTFAAFAVGSGFDLSGAYKNAVNAMSDEIEASIRLYAAGSGQESLPPELALWFQQIKEVIIHFFAGIVMTSMVLASFFNVAVCRRCLYGRLRDAVPLSRFSEWRLPEWLVWPWIAAGIGCFIPHSQYSMIGENALLVFTAVFLVGGMSVAQFLFERFSVPRWIRWTTWLLIGIQWYGLLLLSAMGLADVWVDFRKRFALRTEEGQDNHTDQ